MADKNYAYKSPACKQSLNAVRDTLYVLSGKWKLPIINALSECRTRSKGRQRELVDITPKVLSKEVKELELNEFVTRTVYAASPVTVQCELRKGSQTHNKMIDEMLKWLVHHKHRKNNN